MFDDEDGVPRLDQHIQAVQQLLDVGSMQPSRRLVQDVEVVPPALDLAQLVSRLDALGLAPRELCRGIRTRRATDRRLIDVDHITDEINV